MELERRFVVASKSYSLGMFAMNLIAVEKLLDDRKEETWLTLLQVGQARP
jgi:hypothetical protein